MSRARLALLSLLAVLAVTAVASASASAVSWKVEGSNFSGTETVSGKLASGTKATLSMTVSAVKVKIVCNAASGTGEISGGTKDTSGAVTFSECSVSEPKCTLSSGTTLKTVALTTALTEESSKPFDTYTPTTGTTYVTVGLEGCAAEGEYAVTGSARCEGGAEAVETACDFTSGSGSSLKFGTSAATFEADFVYKLTGTKTGDKWGA